MSRPLDCSIEPCPALPRTGAFSPEEQERFERHLDFCPLCQERIVQAEQDVNALLQVVRRAGDPTAAPIDRTLQDTLEHLYEVKPPRQPASSEPIELTFLGPGQRPGVLGMVGHYEVLEVIGQGGMGIVLKAFDPTLHRLVALKVMSPALADSGIARQRFTREAKAAAAVSHEHIVPIHGVAELAGLPYLVMQYIAGESLQTRLDRTGPLEVAEIVRIGRETASGLAAAHAQGLIHRDIKPANLLLEEVVDGRWQVAGEEKQSLSSLTTRVKITDFGLARLIDDTHLTRRGVIAGTPEYMAPEQALGAAVDHRADLFSLGGVLYALCTGRPPFHADSPGAVLRQVCDEEPVAVRSLNSTIPVWLEELIQRLLAKDPRQRIQSAAELEVLLEAGEPAATREDAFLRSLPLPARQTIALPSWLALLLAMAALGLAAGSWLAGGDDPPRLVPNAEQPPARKQVAFDFRNGIDRFPALTLHGHDAESLAKTDAQGLRLTLPATRPHRDPVGVEVPLRLRGDFDIVVGYEMIRTSTPLPQYGAGVLLRVWFDTPAPLSVILSRFNNPRGDRFGAHRLIAGPDGKDKYLDSAHLPAKTPRGKLRLVRAGSQVRFLVAEEGEEFKTFKTLEMGTEDVRSLQLSGSTVWEPVDLDARFTDLVVEADQFPNGIPSLRDPLVPAETPQEPGSRRGLLAIAFCCLMLVALAGVAAWLLKTARRGSS